MIELFTVFAEQSETSDGVPHLKLHVEANADVFVGMTDEEARSLLKLAGKTILEMVDGIAIDRSELE